MRQVSRHAGFGYPQHSKDRPFRASESEWDGCAHSKKLPFVGLIDVLRKSACMSLIVVLH
jgi:hypothetical protein